MALGGYVAGVLLLLFGAERLGRIDASLALVPAPLILALTIGFARLCAGHTRGRWRCRWGDRG